MSKIPDPEMVLVRVKSASHPSCEDVEFTCDPKSTSVRQVKEKIRTLYSFHPDIADQRLIYAGHLLDDVQLLTDVFGLNGASNTFSSTQSYQHSGPYTIHLACTSKSYVSTSQRNPRSDNPSDGSQTAYPSSIPNPMMADPRLGGNGQSGGYAYSSNGGPLPPEFYALHQLYVEQMSAYMRHWNMAYGFSNPSVGMNGRAPGNVPAFPNINVPLNNPPPPQPAPNLVPQNDRGRPGGVAGNFGGLGGLIGAPAAGNEDEENQRDLLDWAYTLSRFLLILSVVYFYSTFTRFLLVVIFTVAIAIFQRRPFQNHDAQNVGANERQGNNNNNNNNNPVNPPPRVPNRNDAAPDAVDEPGVNGDENQENPINANPAASREEAGVGAAAENNVAAVAGQHRFAYYRDVTWTFLTTFFTSLIPDMPQHN